MGVTSVTGTSASDVGPRGGQATAGLARTGEDVGHRGAELLAAEVAEHDRRDVVRPRQGHGRAGVDDHDRARVRGRDGAHEVVLTAGQIEVLAVVALGLDLRVGADDHDGDVGCRGCSDGGGDQALGVGVVGSDADRRAEDADERRVRHRRG